MRSTRIKKTMVLVACVSASGCASMGGAPKYENGQYVPPPEKEATLNMLILPSPSTDALKKLLPHFYRQTGIKVNLAVYPYDEVFEIVIPVF